MNPIENEAICAFDTLYTNNHIQILKVLLPYFDLNAQKRLAILIKFMELRYTMEYFGRQITSAYASRDGLQQPDIVGIFEQIKSFCTPSERAMFDQLANMKKSMEMYEEMTNMMQLFSQLMPEGAAAESFHASGANAAADAAGYDPSAGPDHSPGNDTAGQGSAAQGAGSFPFGSANPMELLKGMLSPEQQSMFELFSSSFGNLDQTNHASSSEQQ